jgi:RNA polymerase-binding transcription factor DksA
MRRSRHPTSSADRRRDIESLLRAKRAELVEDRERCLATLREPASVDFDNGEVSDLDDRTDAAMMVGHLAREIRAIDDTLTCLAQGDYGVCVSCHRKIPRSRLAANPTARRCVECQARSERRAG